jgi:hypothetical protein
MKITEKGNKKIEDDIIVIDEHIANIDKKIAELQIEKDNYLLDKKEINDNKNNEEYIKKKAIDEYKFITPISIVKIHTDDDFKGLLAVELTYDDGVVLREDYELEKIDRDGKQVGWKRKRVIKKEFLVEN